MNYYIDTEFLEGTQSEKFPISLFRKNTKPTIDLISIGIVAEDGREYYAISKDFNLKEAWNRFDWKQKKVNDGIPGAYKVYWLRDNVLYPIFAELFQKSNPKIWNEDFGNLGNFMGYFERYGNGMKRFKELLDIHGKTNKQIAEEIKDFCLVNEQSKGIHSIVNHNHPYINNFPQFYAYYADYDWVVFCWIFGKMMDLPDGFPMYCLDLKQMLDEKAIKELDYTCWTTKEQVLEHIKTRIGFPKQENEHNALADARWNKKLHEFLIKL